MKINSIITNTGYHLKGRAPESSLGRGRECAKERYDLKQNNNDKINTTIKSNSDGRVSFKGADPSTWLHHVARFSSDKPLLAEALFALLITCGARPLTIMATAKTDEDKEKCHYQVAKSIASGLLGLAATALISTPISGATKALEKSGALQQIPEAVVKKQNEIINNSKIQEHIDKAKKVLSNYPRTEKNVMDKTFQPIFMPLRAKLTIMAVPPILGALGLKKGGNKKPSTPEKQENNPTSNYKLFQNESEKVLFGSFSGVANHEN